MSYLIALIIIMVAGVTFTVFRNDVSAPTIESTASTTDVAVTPLETTAQNAIVEETTSAPTIAEVSAYTNGTHTTSVTYMTPKRSTYLMDVTLTLTADTVTNATIVYSQGAEKDPNAQRFENAYRAEVIGKKIDDLNLSRVGGASLTTNAFNEAVAKIKTSAQS